MATDLYPNVNSVVSNIVEQEVAREPAPIDPDAILIIGTAAKGPLYQPVRINESNVADLFGDAPNDVYGETSLVKGYEEMVRSMGSRTDILAIRVGNATKASIDLYENRQESSGDLSYTDSSIALTLKARTEGDEGNSMTATVLADTGIPTALVIGVPGVEKSLALSVTPSSIAGTYSRVSELAAAINADPDLSPYIEALPNVLEHTEIIDIVSGATTGVAAIRYDIQSVSGSYGDKLIDITDAYTQSLYTDEDSVLGGALTTTLAKTPVKDSNPSTETIDEFWRLVSDEVVIGPVLPADVGTYALPALYAASDSHWVAAQIEDLVVTKTDSNGTVTTLTLTTDYTFVAATGVITLVVGTALNETYKADYSYKATYVEADVRSSLVSGDRYSYFIGGDIIVFGATQPYNLKLLYQAKNQFTVPRDIAIDDADAGIIEFRNPDNYPALGDEVSVTFLYEPELPAEANTNFGSGTSQPFGLSGGSDGRRLVGSEYYAELAKGYLAADNIPIRFVVPQGIYIDDTLNRIDYETGLPTQGNAGFHTQLSLFLRRKSQYVSECEGFISVRPLTPSASDNQATPEEREDWYDRLVNVSATDTTRAANIMASFDDYHVTVLAGTAIFQTGSVYNGSPYMAGFANIYAAMRFHHDNRDSMINKRVPTSIMGGLPDGRLVYPIMAADRLNAINAARYTLITNHSMNGAVIIADAPTAARPSSQFNRQYNVSIVFEAVNRVRFALDPFIGKPNKNAIRQAMETRAKMELQELTPDKLMQFDVRVISDRNDAISGKTRVKLGLVTANEVRKIEIETRMQLGFE